MAAAAGAVAMETVATAATAAMAGKMTAATERDRLTHRQQQEAGGATPGPLVQQWADDLIAHVGSDAVHPGLRPALGRTNQLREETYRLYTALK
jgi:hypothetical protein